MGIYVNDNSISKILLGSEEVSTISLGNTEIYDGGGETEIKDRLEFWGDDSFSLKSGNSGTKHWDGTLEYTTDGENWTTWTGASISSQPKNNAHYLALRGTNNTYLTYQSIQSSAEYNFQFSGNAQYIDCEGDVAALLDYNISALGGSPTMAEKACVNLFHSAFKLRKAPNISMTVLSNECYRQMFYSSYVQEAPKILPATTLATACYYSMFMGCSKLKTVPILPATTAVESCYFSMFNSCAGLEVPPALSVTTLANQCYRGMFGYCLNLLKLPELPTTNLAQECYSYMFNGCQKIKLSATQSEEYSNAYRIPSSGSGTLAYDALAGMFNGTGGAFVGEPSINTTYYTSNEIIPAN